VVDGHDTATAFSSGEDIELGESSVLVLQADKLKAHVDLASSLGVADDHAESLEELSKCGK